MGGLTVADSVRYGVVVGIRPDRFVSSEWVPQEAYLYGRGDTGRRIGSISEADFAGIAVACAPARPIARRWK